MTAERKRIRELREKFFAGMGVPLRKAFKPDPFQIEAIEALSRGEDTLVIAPTGTGKTYIASEGIRTVVKDKKRAVYTAPLKALSNAKYAEFKKLFEPDFSVGLLTGDRKIDADSDVVVATTEIYRNELYSLRAEYGLVVLDELHYLADPQRGPVWEESIILSSRSSTLLMLSASISNPEEMAEWIESIRHKKVRIISVKERPVELRLGFLHPELGAIPLEEDGSLLHEVARFYGGENREWGPREFRKQRFNRRGFGRRR